MRRDPATPRPLHTGHDSPRPRNPRPLHMATENGGAKRRKWFASIMRQSKNGEFYEENLGKQFCGLIADTFNDKNFRRNH